jgi:hypothetical protein
MRALGIEVSGSNSQCAILDGTAEDCKIESVSPARLPLPPDPEEVNRLTSLRKQIHDLIKSSRVDVVGVIRADPGCSPIRAKVECMIQLAARDASVPCTLVAAQTVAAAEKRKVGSIAGPDLENSLRQIKPSYLRKAAHCAWSIINARQG